MSTEPANEQAMKFVTDHLLPIPTWRRAIFPASLPSVGISRIDAAGGTSSCGSRHALPARGELAVAGKAPLPSLQTVLSRSRRLNGGYQSREGSQDHEELSKTLHLLSSSSNSFCGD
jgi:hypothetical protein